MAGKISLKTTVAIFLFFGVVVILSACLEPVDFDAFKNDSKVVEIISDAQTGGGGGGTNVVRVDDKTGDGLRGVNGKITGLKNNKYYMVEKELGTDGEPVNTEFYPAFATDSPEIGTGVLNGFESITRISGGTINGPHNLNGPIGLNNNHTYTVRAAAPFFDGLPFHFSDSGGDANQTVSVSNGVLTIPTPKGDITLIQLNTSFTGYDVMGVAVSPATAPTAFADGKKSIGTISSFKLEGANTLVDYIFYKPDAPEHFYVLRVSIGDVPPEVIDIAAILGVTAPVAGGTPVIAITETTQYTGTVTWAPADGTFAASTVYTATINLTAKTGYIFTGLTASFFTVDGATSVTTIVNNETSATVTAAFPATGKIKIDIAAIPGVVTPEVGNPPVTTGIETAQYTGAVSWSGTLSGGNFTYSTIYTAEITLTAKTEYTFDGVAANFFTVAGATTVTNLAGSGSTCVVTAAFPQTAAPGTANANFTITFTIDNAMNGKLANSGSLPIDRGTFFNGGSSIVLTLNAPDSGSWSNIEWNVGGTKYNSGTHVTGIGGNIFTIDNSKDFWPLLAQTSFEVSVTADISGAAYSGSVTINVTGTVP